MIEKVTGQSYYDYVRDHVCRLADVLRTNTLLGEYYTKLLTTGKVDMPFGGRYAYGFEDRTLNGSHSVGHNGGSPGMNGELNICQDSEYVVAVLANMDPLPATSPSSS